ncbi:hypothetical protein [Paracoccus benzoatiresistens]|uniref:Uncharacterized protein n=1 Tax=Paracoccus benzoatiresistens TaxID=2997341 RepID=A0ABT4J8M3_9RHOB|nr:hypothetical protein [Paracoccus sp. EF6]MCZ0963460.1 hypothetical protein [Paracoccus sp. EF6]
MQHQLHRSGAFANLDGAVVAPDHDLARDLAPGPYLDRVAMAVDEDSPDPRIVTQGNDVILSIVDKIPGTLKLLRHS